LGVTRPRQIKTPINSLSSSNEALTANAPETRYKFCKFCENHARNTPLWGVYITHFGQISVKISVLGVLYPYRCTDGVKFGTEQGSVPNLTPIGATCRPWGAKKPQNRPLGKLNNRRFALCAMLPVNKAFESERLNVNKHSDKVSVLHIKHVKQLVRGWNKVYDA